MFCEKENECYCRKCCSLTYNTIKSDIFSAILSIRVKLDNIDYCEDIISSLIMQYCYTEHIVHVVRCVQ